MPLTVVIVITRANLHSSSLCAQKRASCRWLGWGNPRRFLELLSAAIGDGTVVVLVLICLITLAILILPRIFNP